MKFENEIICGDNMTVMAGMPDNSIDTIITDPQYGLGFMGKDWDKVLPNPITWKQCLRAAKPGAMMLVFGGTRTFHRLTCAIEDAGWQIRDCMMWLYGSGFPKSHDISKGIDKAKGMERKSLGRVKGCGSNSGEGRYNWNNPDDSVDRTHYDATAPATNLAKQWDGYGTALKPAWEPIIVAMKPLDGTFAQNAERWGVGGLWIDGGRIGLNGDYKSKPNGRPSLTGLGDNYEPSEANKPDTQGRWPANVILDEEAAAMLDEQSGTLQTGDAPKIRNSAKTKNCFGEFQGNPVCLEGRQKNTGGASRFFYCAKASRSERNAGLEGMEKKITDDGREKKIDNAYLRGKTLRQNNHPTVKPLKLMEYLCRLTKTPGGGPVLDPFGGSGTTAVACRNTGRNYILIEKDPHYCEIARARVKKEGLFE